MVDATNTPSNQFIQQRCLFKLTKYLIWNPFDSERDYVVTKLKRNADYLMNMPDDILSEIYYRSTKEMVGIESTIFDVGQKCKEIIVILSGVIEISLSDGLQEQHLDLLGRGSIIGLSNILYNDRFAYLGKAMSERGTIIVRIS